MSIESSRHKLSKKVQFAELIFVRYGVANRIRSCENMPAKIDFRRNENESSWKNEKHHVIQDEKTHGKHRGNIAKVEKYFLNHPIEHFRLPTISRLTVVPAHNSPHWLGYGHPRTSAAVISPLWPAPVPPYTEQHLAKRYTVCVHRAEDGLTAGYRAAGPSVALHSVTALQDVSLRRHICQLGDVR